MNATVVTPHAMELSFSRETWRLFVYETVVDVEVRRRCHGASKVSLGRTQRARMFLVPAAR